MNIIVKLLLCILVRQRLIIKLLVKGMPINIVNNLVDEDKTVREALEYIKK
jgi:hypothetical protein